MVAIPLNDKSSTTISDLYGNAPYFALLDTQTGQFKVIENGGCGNGEDTAQCVIDSGASSTIFYHMGEGVYNFFSKNEVNVYSVSKVFASLDEIYRTFKKSGYRLLTEANSSNLLDAGNCTCEKQ